MIEILTPVQLEQARPSGRFVAATLQALRERVQPGTNLLDIDAWTRDLIASAGAESCYVEYAPAFGRGPFGKVICTSVNDAVLHGLPHDYHLVSGDLLTLDFAVSLHGWVADAAISFIVGGPGDPEDQRLIDTTTTALAAGIDAARPGGHVGGPHDAPGPAHPEPGGARAGVPAAAGDAACDRAVGDAWYPPAGPRPGRLDAAQREWGTRRALRTYDRDHTGWGGDPDAR